MKKIYSISVYRLPKVSVYYCLLKNKPFVTLNFATKLSSTSTPFTTKNYKTHGRILLKVSLCYSVLHIAIQQACAPSGLHHKGL